MSNASNNTRTPARDVRTTCQKFETNPLVFKAYPKHKFIDGDPDKSPFRCGPPRSSLLFSLLTENIVAYCNLFTRIWLQRSVRVVVCVTADASHRFSYGGKFLCELVFRSWTDNSNICWLYTRNSSVFQSLHVCRYPRCHHGSRGYRREIWRFHFSDRLLESPEFAMM